MIKRNKINFSKILELSIYVTLFLLFLSINLFTESVRFHFLPLIFSVLFGVLLFLWLFIFKNIRVDYVVITYAIFICFVSLMTLIISKDFGSLKTTVFSSSLMLLIYEFLYNGRNIKLFLIVYILSIVVYAIIFLIVYLPEIASSFPNIFDLSLGRKFDNRNAVANTFLSGIICCLGFTFLYKKYFVNIFLSLIFSFIILTTGSRTGILSIFLCFLTYIFLIFYKKHKIICFSIIAVFIVSCVLLFTLPIFSGLKERFSRMFNLFSGEKTDVQGRFSMLITGFEYFLKHVFTGIGAGGYGSTSNYAGYSHATISETLCNFGLIGTFLYFWPIFRSLSFSKKTPSNLRFIILFIVGYLLMGMFGTVLFARKSFYILVGIVLFLGSECKTDKLFKIEIKYERKN